MSETVFVDSNVLIYARDRVDRAKQKQAKAWMQYLWESGRGYLSAQVLNEYYVVMTRGRPSAAARKAARSDCEALEAWAPVPIDVELQRLARAVEDRFGFSWWDCLIVAAAMRAQCSVLLTEDFQAGQMLGSLRVVNPFAAAPP